MSEVSRIWYQSFVDPVAQRPYFTRLQALLDTYAAPDVRFEVHGIDPPDRYLSPLTEMRCAAQAVHNAIEAERSGCAAFVFGHFQDAGLLETRDGALRLTDRGVLLSNEVFQEFLAA